MEDLTKLTTKQQLFCEFYIGAANGNATEAARLAGYQGSDKTLRAIGSQNLTKLNISQVCQERVNEVALSADKVLSELSEIAKADWQDFLEIRHDKDGEIISATLKLSDKIKALELLGKYHKLFSDRVDLNLQVNDWRVEAAKYGLSTHDIIRQLQPLIAESALESGDASGD